MILYGASGHAKVVIDICKKLNINISAIVDDNKAVTSILNYSVCTLNEIDVIHDKVIISIGNNSVRKRIVEELHVEFGSIAHPKAVIDITSKIKEGTVVMAGAVINSSAVIGKHCIVNTSASIEF